MTRNIAQWFQFKIIGSFQDALSRQISEAVRVGMRCGGVLNSQSEYSRCKLPRLTIDRDTWNSQKQAKSSIESGAEKKMEKLSKELEENFARPATRAFLKNGKRRKNKSGGNKRKRLRLDPVVGWGEGEICKEDLEIQDWLIIRDNTDKLKENEHQNSWKNNNNNIK